MLEPITRDMTDKSNEKAYCFTFYCDICKNAWDSAPIGFSQTGGNSPEMDKKAVGLNRDADYYAAYERANHEAMQHFNRCPVCRRWVCDSCFRILGERDVCKECAEK